MNILILKICRVGRGCYCLQTVVHVETTTTLMSYGTGEKMKSFKDIQSEYLTCFAHIQQMDLDTPYNPLNILLDDSSLARIIETYHKTFKFTDINLYRTALVHKSYCTRKNENFQNGNTLCPKGCLPLQEESHERLEFLGDAVIGLVIGSYLFERYPDESEGFLTKIRTKLVNGIMLSELCGYAHIPKYIIISKQIEENNGRHNKKILEDTFEAFVGAMFLDAKKQGCNELHVVRDWLICLIEENIDFTDLLLSNNNYKDMFMKHYQHTYNAIPRFVELTVDATNNGKIYKVAIRDGSGAILSTGTGGTKKQAENDAAYSALKYYGQI